MQAELCMKSFAAKLLLVTLKTGVGRGDWPLTFLYGDHGEDISTKIMFQRTHTRPLVLN